MKLAIGDNIRIFRKKNNLTQEELAERLGVTYQSVSRWENGTTYPDLELLPAISELLTISIDALLGMPQAEKEKKAAETFDELRRECMKKEYDAERIVMLIRDIRRNYMNSESAWRPWVEGNGRAFRDSRILPEVRLMAEAYLQRCPMNAHVIKTMSCIEDEEHLEDFLQKYTTPFDCSRRTLLFDRYFQLGNKEQFEPERRYQFYAALRLLLCPRYLIKWGEDAAGKQRADAFMAALLTLIRRDAVDNAPDMWIEDRIELGLKCSAQLASTGKIDQAIVQAESVVKLLEEAMQIKDERILPTSCHFLEGMEWTAKEDWMSRGNDPDAPEERMIFISTRMSDMTACYCVFPSDVYNTFGQKDFEPLKTHPAFAALCNRVKALIQTRNDHT